MSSKFTAFGIRAELLDALRQDGIVEPTPIQSQSIPALMAGRDLIGQAQTGTGKTLAFVLPILERVEPSRPFVQALIVAPTRELAIQITTEIRRLADVIGASVLAVYGGQDVDAQIRKLKSAPAIVVGTPGRLLDHVRRETVNLSGVKYLVLDEADQMLHMGFLEDVETIIRLTPNSRQTMLFSATMPDKVRRLAAKYMREPLNIKIESKFVAADDVSQFIVETTDRAKLETLAALIKLYQPYLALVFCRTKIRAKRLNEQLLEYGIESDELHGDLTQSKREQVMERFRNAKLQVLVATDIASRGLDVEGITHVFNYDIPEDAESYIHRIGRTGRAGQTGVAITLASPRDGFYINLIEQGIGSRLEKRKDREFRGEAGLSLGDEGSDTAPSRQNGRADRAASQGSGVKGRGRGERRGARDGGRAGRPAGAGTRGGGGAGRPAGAGTRGGGGAGRPAGAGTRGGDSGRERSRGEDGRSWGTDARPERGGMPAGARGAGRDRGDAARGDAMREDAGFAPRGRGGAGRSGSAGGRGGNGSREPSRGGASRSWGADARPERGGMPAGARGAGRGRGDAARGDAMRDDAGFAPRGRGEAGRSGSTGRRGGEAGAREGGRAGGAAARGGNGSREPSRAEDARSRGFAARTGSGGASAGTRPAGRSQSEGTPRGRGGAGGRTEPGRGGGSFKRGGSSTSGGSRPTQGGGGRGGRNSRGPSRGR